MYISIYTHQWQQIAEFAKVRVIFNGDENPCVLMRTNPTNREYYSLIVLVFFGIA